MFPQQPSSRTSPQLTLTTFTHRMLSRFATSKPTQRFRLSGKNALITGGSRGLGLHIACKLASRGTNVAIVARDPQELERASEQLRGVRKHNDVYVLGQACDLRDGRAIDAMLAYVQALLGPIDILINNAGAEAMEVGPMDAMSIDDFERALQLHCFAALRTVLAVRDSMRARGGGRIANVASIGGPVALPHLLPYSVSKFALVGLSQGLREELARDAIFVSTIAPGPIRTDSRMRASCKGEPQKQYAWFTGSDSLPMLSMTTERAACRIVRAIERGDAYVVLGAPAKLAALANGLAPGLTTRLLTAVNAALPRGSDPRSRRGFELAPDATATAASGEPA